MDSTVADYETAAIIIVGNEILNGRIHDLNSHYLCQELFQLGLKVGLIVTITDDVQVISNEVKRISPQFDLVFIAGGIGPTPDDVTMKGIAEAFSMKLVEAPQIAEIITQRLEEEFDPHWLKMAQIPEKHRLLGLEENHYPVVQVQNVLIFPGVPFILKKKFERIKESLKSTPFLREELEVHDTEARLVPLMEKVLRQFPDVQLGSYPVYPDAAGPFVRLSLESKDKQRLKEASLFLQSLLKLAHIK